MIGAQSIRTPLVAIALFALALWTGGLVTLGAIVAPIVFGVVPAPTNADAMTLVFGRFDGVAVTCAIVVLLVEAIHGATSGRIGRFAIARAANAVFAGALAFVEAFAISPKITALHRAGAVRGFGELGRALDSLHHLAESLAKVELVLLLSLFVLQIMTLRSDRAAGAPRSSALRP